jgi:hypothetical protein
MIKFIVGSIVILALIGGAVEFESTDKDYSPLKINVKFSV